MRMRAATILVVLMGIFAAWSTVRGRQQVAIAPSCHHDAASTDADRTRRAQALDLARAINAAEGRAAALTRRYVPLTQLLSLPDTPQGFQVRFYLDSTGYMFSIKDQRDPCHYGVFSDQEGRLYEMTPAVPQIAS